MESRLELHELLVNVLGSRNVYFQPPESLKLQYPAIVYQLSDINNNFAGDGVYKQSHFYDLTVIDYDPDSEIMHKLSKLSKVRFDRHFIADNLNHYTFRIYY